MFHNRKQANDNLLEQEQMNFIISQGWNSLKAENPYKRINLSAKEIIWNIGHWLKNNGWSCPTMIYPEKGRLVVQFDTFKDGTQRSKVMSKFFINYVNEFEMEIVDK